MNRFAYSFRQNICSDWDIVLILYGIVDPVNVVDHKFARYTCMGSDYVFLNLKMDQRNFVMAF